MGAPEKSCFREYRGVFKGVYSFVLFKTATEYCIRQENDMKARMLLLTVALCFAGTALSFAQSPQMGTWKLDEAKSSIERWRALEPKSAEPLCSLARIAQERNDLPAEERAYREALGIDPANVDAAVTLAGILRHTDRADEAAVILARAAKDHPHDALIEAARPHPPGTW